MAGQSVVLQSPLTTADTAATVVNKINTDLSSLQVELARKVTPGDMLVTSDLSMVGHYLTEVAGVVLEDSGLAPSGLGTVYYSGGDFWLVTSGGAVQITKSGAVNVASAGGINGDYPGASGASVTYTHSTLTYTFMDSASAWAKLKAKSYYISNVSDTAAAELKNVAAANTTWTFGDLPVTAAGVYHLMTVDSAGGIRENDVVDAAVTFNGGFTSAASATFSAGFTSASDQRHSDVWTLPVEIDATTGTSNAATYRPAGVPATANIVAGMQPSANPWEFQCHIRGLRVGDKITAANVKVAKTSGGTVTLELRKYDYSTGIVSAPLSGSTSAVSGTVSLSTTIGTPVTVTANDKWYLAVKGTTDLTAGVYNPTISVTHP